MADTAETLDDIIQIDGEEVMPDESNFTLSEVENQLSRIEKNGDKGALVTLIRDSNEATSMATIVQDSKQDFLRVAAHLEISERNYDNPEGPKELLEAIKAKRAARGDVAQQIERKRKLELQDLEKTRDNLMRGVLEEALKCITDIFEAEGIDDDLKTKIFDSLEKRIERLAL